MLLLLGALGAKGTSTTPSKKGSSKPETADAAQLAVQNARLRKQLDLASGETFYYTLDPTRRLLRFMYQGNLLFERKLLDVEVGTRRGFLGKGSAPSDWAERVWASGELDPPRHLKRTELDAGSEDFMTQREVIEVPPTPEEAYPAPAVWWIRYSGGLAVEVHGLERQHEDTSRFHEERGAAIPRRHEGPDGLASRCGEDPHLPPPRPVRRSLPFGSSGHALYDPSGFVTASFSTIIGNSSGASLDRICTASALVK